MRVVLSPRPITSPLKSPTLIISPIQYWFSNIIVIPDIKSLSKSWRARPTTSPSTPSEAINDLVSTPKISKIIRRATIKIKYLTTLYTNE